MTHTRIVVDHYGGPDDRGVRADTVGTYHTRVGAAIAAALASVLSAGFAFVTGR
jgi:hypothetical protein